jgi:hypothetical protein
MASGRPEIVQSIFVAIGPLNGFVGLWPEHWLVHSARSPLTGLGTPVPERSTTRAASADGFGLPKPMYSRPTIASASFPDTMATDGRSAWLTGVIPPAVFSLIDTAHPFRSMQHMSSEWPPQFSPGRAFFCR